MRSGRCRTFHAAVVWVFMSFCMSPRDALRLSTSALYIYVACDVRFGSLFSFYLPLFKM